MGVLKAVTLPIITPSPPPTAKQQCLVFVSIRGPGFNQQAYAGARHFNDWTVYISDPSLPAPDNNAPFPIDTYFAWNDCWTSQSAGIADQDAAWLNPSPPDNVAPAPPEGHYQTFQWGFMVGTNAPCYAAARNPPSSITRDYGTFSAPMPGSFVNSGQGGDGCTYQLSSDGNPVTGDTGTCGSTDCDCIYTGGISPLVIDFRGEGIQFTDLPQGLVQFDLGTWKFGTSWLSNPASSKFLALDRNGNGKIDDINELFGNATIGPDGKPAATGFSALEKYDANRDGVIDSKDPIYSKLLVWSDYNINGKTDPGELKTLKESGIRSINLRRKNKLENRDRYGNFTAEYSTVTFSDGKVRKIYDVWFAMGAPSATNKSSEVKRALTSRNSAK